MGKYLIWNILNTYAFFWQSNYLLPNSMDHFMIIYNIRVSRACICKYSKI